jgi:uncharacterized repeat protein (TIGR03803 family)
LYGFCALRNCSDGATPGAALVQGRDGNFYGTTIGGGGGRQCSGGCGTVLKIAPDGTLTTLHRFDFSNGGYPYALILGFDGTLYGTTAGGGIQSSACDSGFGGCGTLFKMTPLGGFSILYKFCSQPDCADGSQPLGVIEATGASLYGVTVRGGLGTSDCGTIYRIARPGMLRTLHAFDQVDGCFPATLVQATDGNFYGVTTGGGPSGWGTIFSFTPAGKLTRLHTFCAGQTGSCQFDGATPTGLFQATDGKFYGSTYQGGTSGSGTFFSLDVGLEPFVSFVSDAGKVGQSRGILGQGFTGTTSVSFNGIPAKFTVISNTFIKTTVPAGATTSYVTVTTPSGKLTSNVPFQVIP